MKTSMLTVANWFIIGYFCVLFYERTQSLVKTVNDANISFFGDGFHSYVNALTVLSLLGFLVILFTMNRQFLASLFSADAEVHANVSMAGLAIAIGVILLSGMVHTEYTIPAIQFGSYGLLIVALILYTVYYQGGADSKLMLWLSLIYLIALSMAIPVVYKSEIKMATLFHVTEAVVSVVLVAVFAYLTFLVLAGKATNLFLLIPILIAVVGDVLVLSLRWKEQVNMFVLVSLAAASILWVVGKVCEKVIR